MPGDRRSVTRRSQNRHSSRSPSAPTISSRRRSESSRSRSDAPARPRTSRPSNDEKLDEVLRTLRGFGSALSTQSYDIGLIKNQISAQTQRCDQLTINMNTLTTDIQNKISQIEGQQSSMYMDLNGRFDYLKAHVSEQIKNELTAQEARTNVPHFNMEDDSDAAHKHVQSQIDNIQKQLRSLSTPPSTASSSDRSHRSSSRLLQKENTCKLIAV
eukprot:3350044-Pyramimonas_sp.AAC.1